VGKSKLIRFKEMEKFERVFQPNFGEVFENDYYLKGCWNLKVFHNNHPIVLELGCGKGEYSIGLAKLNPDKNYIGIDIKGARIWKGAKIVNEENITNVAFVRTRIELIRSFFQPGEVDEIWITFPDPQLKKRRNKKRLTGVRYLNYYRSLLIDKGIIHLKTDNHELFNYTLDLITYNGLRILNKTKDLYNSSVSDPALSICTFYENQFLEEGLNIHYLSFELPSGKHILELPEDEE